MNNDVEWFGVALHQGKLYLITGILADFILDYRAYDPEYCAKNASADFRDGILTVTVDNIPQFLRALKARLLTTHEGRLLAESAVNEPELLAFIDFDSHRYIHSYYHLELEDYIPKKWRGALGNPRQELKRLYHIR